MGEKKKERYGEVPFRIKLYAERESWRFRICIEKTALECWIWKDHSLLALAFTTFRH